MRELPHGGCGEGPARVCSGLGVLHAVGRLALVQQHSGGGSCTAATLSCDVAHPSAPVLVADHSSGSMLA
jgi:hypothetical protein